jgi:fructokinase
MAVTGAAVAYAGIELGGTKILCRLMGADGARLGEVRFATSTPTQALADLTAFLRGSLRGRALTALGVASFGPIGLDPSGPDYGRLLATPKPGWAGFDLRGALLAQFPVPLALDTDVNAAALAEQARGAGRGLGSVAYVTVGTGIGAGLALEGRTLRGALHPEAGHLRLRRRAGDDVPSSCPFHEDCAEGLASGPAVARRLGNRRSLADDPRTFALVATYLGELAASLVLCWSPHRILLGGGVMAAEGLRRAVAGAMQGALGDYLPGPVRDPDYLAAPELTDAGLEGALMLARAVTAQAAAPAPAGGRVGAA